MPGTGHWPLLVLAPAVVGHPLSLVPNLGLAAAGGLLAAATVRLVENPVRFSARLAARPSRSLTLAAALTATAAAAAIATANLSPAPQGRGVAAPPATIPIAPPARTRSTKPHQDPAEARLAKLFAPVLEAVAKAARARTVPANLDPPLASAHANQPPPVADGCLICWQGVSSGPCRYGVAGAHRTVVLFGDSHALQWFPALDHAARVHRWRLESLTKTTCPPVELSFWSPVLGRPYRECDQWRATILARIRAEHPALVVLGAARHYGDVYHFKVYGQPWISGLAKMVRQVRATGAQALVLGPTPKATGRRARLPGRAPPRRHRLHHPAAGGHQHRRHGGRTTGSPGRRWRLPGRHPWLCTRSTCAVEVGNLLAYRDDKHLTTTYTTLLATLLGDQLDQTLGGPIAGAMASPAFRGGVDRAR